MRQLVASFDIGDGDGEERYPYCYHWDIPHTAPSSGVNLSELARRNRDRRRS